MIGGKYAEMVLLGFRNMWGYKLRTFLSMLSISFGIASVIAIFATAEGAQREILAQIGRFGIRNIIINSVKPPAQDEGSGGGATSWISRYGLTFKDHRQIEATVESAMNVFPVHTLLDTVWIGSRKVDARIHGVLPEQMKLLKLDVQLGRNLTDLDNIGLKRTCVVRPGLLRALGFFGEPLGHLLQIGSEFYEIVGVMYEEEFNGLTRKALNADSRNLELYRQFAFRRQEFAAVLREFLDAGVDIFHFDAEMADAGAGPGKLRFFGIFVVVLREGEVDGAVVQVNRAVIVAHPAFAGALEAEDAFIDIGRFESVFDLELDMRDFSHDSSPVDCYGIRISVMALLPSIY